MSDRWIYEDGILNLGARALVKAISTLANSEPGGACRALFLGDNLAVILSFGRWRAKNFKLLVQLRRAAALALPRNIKLYFRRLPSELTCRRGQS